MSPILEIKKNCWVNFHYSIVAQANMRCQIIKLAWLKTESELSDGKVWELAGFEHDTDHSWFYGQVSIEASQVETSLMPL